MYVNLTILKFIYSGIVIEILFFGYSFPRKIMHDNFQKIPLNGYTVGNHYVQNTPPEGA